MPKYERLAYCGIYCGGCLNYRENMDCAGCRAEEDLISDCPTKVCAEKKGFIHCGECDEFPCRHLNKFYEDGIRHHKQAYRNILRLREIGLDAWLGEQEREHICSCGSRKSWFAEKCKECL